jgi:hypothetical protein
LLEYLMLALQEQGNEFLLFFKMNESFYCSSGYN